MMNFKTDELELAAVLAQQHELIAANLGPRGRVQFEFPPEAEALADEYREKDLSIPSLREFSKAHRRLRLLISNLKFEVRGKNNVTQSHRS